MREALNLDPKSPVPLYHQLAEALRYRIATGVLKPESRLPPLRIAARDWGVNLHTIRRAYSELEAAGVVETRVPQGTRVKAAAAVRHGRSSAPARARFVQAFVNEARLRHGMSVDDLARELTRSEPAARERSISVVECSQTQCDDLAAQVSDRWRVRALPRSLQQNGVPPPGLIVATYFHYNDVRQRWPERIGDLRFLPIAPEPELASRLKRGRRGTGKWNAVLCERDISMARNIAADLGRLLAAKDFHLETEVVSKAEACLKRKGARTAILLSPRMWGELPARLREDPRVHQVRYVFDPGALEELGAEQGWESR
jgi:DNA-binding transcriptional regulator YhcF (GntR family)